MFLPTPESLGGLVTFAAFTRQASVSLVYSDLQLPQPGGRNTHIAQVLTWQEKRKMQLFVTFSHSASEPEVLDSRLSCRNSKQATHGPCPPMPASVAMASSQATCQFPEEKALMSVALCSFSLYLSYLILFGDEPYVRHLISESRKMVWLPHHEAGVVLLGSPIAPSTQPNVGLRYNTHIKPHAL